MVYIYILQLEYEKYYIGKTFDVNFRIDKHFTNNGSMWTNKYKPITILAIIANCDDYDEDKHTIIYMEKYGINNVRGGSFCEIKLSDNNIKTLQQMIKSATDKCYICGKNGHFAINCKIVSVKNEKIPTIDLNEQCDCITSFFSSHRRKKCALNKIISYFDNEDDDKDLDKLIAINSCSRCGRQSHSISQCYASKHVDGSYLKKR